LFIINKLPTSDAAKTLLVHLIVFFVIASTVWLTPQISNIDRKINDLVQQSSNTKPSDNLVLVDIDQQTITAAKSFPVTRGYIADALAGIAKSNPQRVLVDILFIADGNPADDQKLVTSLAKFKNGMIALAGMNSAYTGGKPAPNVKFRNNTVIVNSIMSQDNDGNSRRMGEENSAGQSDLYNPARWLAGQNSSAPILIDQSIKPDQYQRYSLSDFVGGNAPNLSGKFVIIGQISKLLGSPVQYPLYGHMDRTQFIALGADTLISGEEQTNLSNANLFLWLIAISLAAYLTALLLVKNGNIITVSLIGTIFIISSNMLLYHYLNIGLNIIVSLSIWKAALFISLAYRYRIIDAVTEVMSGDLSPEEAWQWRVMKKHGDPFVLLGLKGIKRINKAAKQAGIFDDDGSNLNKFQQFLVGQTSQENSSVSLTINDQSKEFSVSQPFENIALYQMHDVTHESVEKARLSKLVVTDQLTNCLNKQGFEEVLNETSNTGLDYSVFILDLNGFKAANDQYGHLAGDMVLAECAKRLKTALRSTDVLARIGGDEFAVIARGNLDEDNLLLIRDKLERSIGTYVQVGNDKIKIGVAAGYGKAMAGNTTSEVVANADASMYARKSFMKSTGVAFERGKVA
jgi:diguanylate cyclase (GGDEF)-like protein